MAKNSGGRSKTANTAGRPRPTKLKGSTAMPASGKPHKSGTLVTGGKASTGH